MTSKLLAFALTLCMGLLLFAPAVLGQEYDFGGATLRVSNRMWGVTHLGQRNDYDWYDPDVRLQQHIEAVEDMFNVKIEFVQPRDRGPVVDEIRSGALAGETAFDTALLDMREAIPELALDGLLAPLGDVLGQDYYDRLPPELHPRGAFDVVGETYAFPALQQYWDGPTGLLWNKDMFEREGLPNLYDLYDAGNWTWEPFREIAIDATKDTTGDGEIDQWGIRFERVIYWLATNNVQFARMEDGRRVVNFEAPEIIEAFEFLQELFELGAATTGGGSEEIAMRETYIHRMGTSAYQEDARSEFGIIPYPKGPNADEHIVPQWNVWGGVIPITVTHDLRGIVEVVNALQMMIEPYENQDVWHERYWEERMLQVYDQESLELWQWMDRGARLVWEPEVRLVMEMVDFRATYGGDVNHSIINEGANPATVMSRISPQAQVYLDEILGQ